MEIKTSETSPIRVDFVEGRPLGMTFAPGKTGPSLVGSYFWERSLHADLDRLTGHFGVSVLVSLIEPEEFESLQIEDLRNAARSAGMVSYWFPIKDRDVPDDMGSFIALVRTIRSALSAGDRVVLHCRGGLGRAGTVAACTLVSLGEDVDEAVSMVRESRPGAIENARQEAFVDRFATYWKRFKQKE